MPTQTAGDVGQNRHSVLELDGERRAREYLADGSVDFECFFLHRLGGTGRRGRPPFGVMDAAAAGYDATAFVNLMMLLSP
jgi:hypothetical protein